MKLYMDFGDAWDLMFRSFLVFIFVGLLWLRFMDPIVSCSIGFPVPLLAAGLYFYWGWRRARKVWLHDEVERQALEAAMQAPAPMVNEEA